MEKESLEIFANILKDFRKNENITLNDLSKYLGVSDVYVSKLENAKRFPSKKILFNYLLFMEISEKYDDKEKLLKIFSENKNVDYESLESEYEKHREEYLNQRRNHSNKIYNNEIKLEINKLGKIKITELDEPYFDLKWLLTQSKYKVFFSGLDKHSEELIDFKDVLNEEDKKMLFDVVNSILKRIYNE